VSPTLFNHHHATVLHTTTTSRQPPQCLSCQANIPLQNKPKQPKQSSKIPPSRYSPPLPLTQTTAPANVAAPEDLTATDDLIALDPAPAAIRVRHGTPSPPPMTDPPADPFNLDNYLLTSSEGFSPFDQNLGTAPFHDLHGEEIWAALAYTEDGGVHPGKVHPVPIPLKPYPP
jgi:hypothetical protein